MTTLCVSQSCFFKEMKKGRDVFLSLIIKTIRLERYGENLSPLGIQLKPMGRC